MITCQECGRENDDEYKYCLGCGAALQESGESQEESGDSEIINCPYCGAEQPSNFKFCGACGEKIPESTGASEEQEPAEDFEDAVSTSPGKPGGDGEEEGAASVESGEGTTRTPEQDQPAAAGIEETEGRSETPRGGKPAQSAANRERGDESASEGAAAKLVVIRPDGTEGASIDVPKDKLTIGRDSDIEALSSDPFLSPEHASFLFQDGRFVIRDEESLNGIFREVTDQIELQDGDMIRVGQELIRFELYDEERPDADDETLTAGSPDPGYWGRLTLVAGPDVHTEAYGLGESEITIGRETGDIVFRDDGFVSGTHARVARTNGTPILQDLDSSNGTFIRIRDDYQLGDGERVLMGQQLFRLEANV